MPRIITGVRRRKPFVGAPLRAVAVASRPPVRPIVAALVRRPFVGRGTVGRPAKIVVPVFTKRPPAVLVAAPRRIAPVLGRAFVGRPTRTVAVPPAARPPVALVAALRRPAPVPVRAFVGRPARAVPVPPAKRPPTVLVARAPRTAPVPGRGLVLRVPARGVAPVPRRPLPALVARVAFARPFVARAGVLPAPPRFVVPPEPEPGTPGGTWRRPGWSWARVWRRPGASWGRVWRYRPVSATRIPPAALSKPASEPRWFAVSLAEAPEVVAGEALSAPELLPGGGPDGLTISGIVVLDAVFDRIPIGRGVKFFVEGGAPDTVYNFAIRVTTSGGSKPVVPCRLVVTPDYDSE